MSEPVLLEVRGLSVGFRTGVRGEVRSAVEDVHLTVARGRRVGLVGESGSGKSLTSLAILGLLDESLTLVSGQVRFRGEDLCAAGPERSRKLRGDRLALVFQDPLAAMNPVRRVGAQVIEALTVRRRLGRDEARARAVELLQRVGMPDAEARVDAFPHELSGGMRQRACIAMALACDPELLIADEPTTALDVTVQAQVLDLLGSIQSERGLGVLLISHDLGLVAGWCDDVNVLYAGQLVESGPASRVLSRPRHPYTAGLLQSLPTPGVRQGRLPELPGRVPEPGQRVDGCRFHPRCSLATVRCRTEAPRWRALPDGGVRCHHPLGDASEGDAAPQDGLSTNGIGGAARAAAGGAVDSRGHAAAVSYDVPTPADAARDSKGGEGA